VFHIPKEPENSNSIPSVNSNLLGNITSGWIEVSGAADFFSLTASSRKTLSVAMDLPTNSTVSHCATLGLLNANGNSLGPYQAGSDKPMSSRVAWAGTYYLGTADTSSGLSTNYDSGEYTLTTSLAAGSADGFESESNNSIDSADDIMLAPLLGPGYLLRMIRIILR